ncbi:hypothetical protein ZORO111903_00510 [Zobellia roscoffensis]
MAIQTILIRWSNVLGKCQAGNENSNKSMVLRDFFIGLLKKCGLIKFVTREIEIAFMSIFKNEN